ncbi:MAG: hypothetical protein LBL76_06760 [Treponema sp.]|nr:hypothetical protein [Treponema sp.]
MGIHTVNIMKKNMRREGIIVYMKLKRLLRKRAVIESVNDILKNICQPVRSPVNFLANLLAGLSAYSFLPHKPSIRGFQDERALPLLFNVSSNSR